MDAPDAPGPRRCEICNDPIRPNNATGICTRKDRPECRRANAQANALRKQQEAGLSDPRRCDVCSRPINRNNKYGVCSSSARPECVQEYNRRAWAARNQDKPKPRFCEVCKDPIRIDNAMGICRNPERIACQRERRKREALAEGRTPPMEFFPGDTFGHWTVLEYYYARGGGGVLVRCDCVKATVRRVRPSRLTDGSSTSCGCERYVTRARRKRPYLRADAVYGPFTVLEDVARGTDQVRILCAACGNEKMLAALRVKLGLADSCGCLTETHGFTKHPLYQLWASMVQRCHNPNHASYHRYGGRVVPGPVTVCDRWRLDPWMFAEDIYREIGPRPEDRNEKGYVVFELDRIDNDLGYFPGNVRWADKKTQAQNKSTATGRESELATVMAERDALAAELDAVIGERDDLAFQVELMKAQIGAVAGQSPTSRRRGEPTASEEPLF